MAELKNPKHEQFAQHFAKGNNASQAYVKAGYSDNRANSSAQRLLTNADIRARVNEIKGKIADGVINQEIGHRSARMAAYQDRWCKMKAVIAARAIDPALSEVAGGSTGLVVITDYKEQIDIDYSGGKPVKTVTLVPKYAVDTGLLRGDARYRAAGRAGYGPVGQRRTGSSTRTARTC